MTRFVQIIIEKLIFFYSHYKIYDATANIGFTAAIFVELDYQILRFPKTIINQAQFI